jgi:hypothetical protein
MRLKARLGVENSHNRELRKNLIFRSSKALHQRIMNFLNIILPGDIRSEWFFYALKQINESLDLAAYDFVITSHEPGVDSLIGLYLKKKKGNINWVADFGDPYVTPLYTSLFKLWYEKRFEKSIYRNADVLIFTSRTVIQHLYSLYRFLEDKRPLLLEQGFSYAFSTTLKKRTLNKSVFTLVYTGTFYRNFRNPSNFIRALSSLDFDFEFVLAGRNEEFLKNFEILGDKFRYMGLLEHFETLRLQEAGDILVHISNNNSIQFPGKFYEYLGSYKPILSIVHSLDDPSIQIIKSLDCGVVCRNSPEEIRDAIMELYEKHLNGCYLKSIKPEKIYDYSWEKKAKILWDYLEDVNNKNAILKNN